MNGVLTGNLNNIFLMQYTAVTGEGIQNINGINLKVNTSFANNGQTVKITYILTNTTGENAIISLATTADVQIDNDDAATIERIADGSVRLWTDKGNTRQPVQFVFYGKGLEGVTNIDNLWIGNWSGDYMKNMFNNNPGTNIIEDEDSAFTFSWTNRTLEAGETQTYSVLMEVGEVYIPEVSELDLADNQKFFVNDVRINGTVRNSNLIDEVTIYYTIDNGEEFTLPPLVMDGTAKNFTINLTDLGLELAVPHKIKVWSVGSTGLRSNAVERTFYITNLREPELIISETEWTKEDVTFKIIDTENESQYVDKYQYKINNGSWTDTEEGVDISITEQGIVTVSARILGSTQGDSSLIVTDIAKIDQVPPTKTIPTATATSNSISMTSKQIDNESGLDTTKTRYAIKKGNTWGEWQTENTFIDLISDTQYVVKTQSTDNVGNISESEELTIKTLTAAPYDTGKDYPDDTVAPKDLPKTGKVVLYGTTMSTILFAIITFKKYTALVLK